MVRSLRGQGVRAGEKERELKRDINKPEGKGPSLLQERKKGYEGEGEDKSKKIK